MSEKYIELKKENLIFEGTTEKEKKINETIYELCLENDTLYEKNKSLKEDIKGYEQERQVFFNYLDEKNKKIKNLESILRNTTHCFDEAEHEKLKNENEELKKINGSLQNALSLSQQKYNNDKQRYRRKYKKKHDILIEFEKWLVETYYLDIPEVAKNSPIKEIYNKLQELKESDKQ